MLRERLNKDLLIFDGGFGSQLQELGMKAGEIPEYYNIEHPEMIIDIHHLKAGADFITTNTFGANPLKLEQHKYSYQEVILAAIQNAKEAKKIKPDAYIALDIGPIGKLMEPMGTLTFDEVYQSVKQMVELVKEDIDVVLLMSVNPGFSGQKYISSVDEKIAQLVELKEKYGYEVMLDGACSPERVETLSKVGVKGFILGTSALFGKEKSYKEIVKELRSL